MPRQPLQKKGGNFTIFTQKEERRRRKQERALRRIRKAKRNLRLTSVTEGDGYAHDSQTEDSEAERTCTTFNNIGSTNGVATRATEMICEVKTGQPATDGAAQRAEEEEVKGNIREK